MVCKPRACDIDFPNQCMLKCKMCYFWKNDRSVKFENWPSLEEYRKFLHGLKSFVDDSFEVSFGGGEPLLFSQTLFDIAKICKSLSFKSYFPTNAFLLDEEMAQKIAQSGISSIGLSLDSLNDQTHDYIRGTPGSFKQVMRALEHLKKYCPHVSVNILTVIMGLNLNEIIDLTKWVCDNSHIQNIEFQAIQTPFNVECPQAWYDLEEYKDLWVSDPLMMNSVIDELIRFKALQSSNPKISNSIAQLRSFRDYFLKSKNLKEAKKVKQCHLGDGVLRLDWNGDIAICLDMENLGNIKKEGIKDIWYSQKANEIRSQILECKKDCHNNINCFQE